MSDVHPWLNTVMGNENLLHFGNSYNRWLEFWALAKPP